MPACRVASHWRAASLALVWAVFLAGPASAQEALARLPDGRLVVTFRGVRAVLPEIPAARTEVSLTFPGGRPLSGTPEARAYDQKTYWPVPRIVENPEEFTRTLATARSLLAIHFHFVDRSQFDPQFSKPVPTDDPIHYRNAYGVRVLVGIADKRAIVGVPGTTITGSKQGRFNTLLNLDRFRRQQQEPGATVVEPNEAGFLIFPDTGQQPGPTAFSALLPRERRPFPAFDDLIISCGRLIGCLRESFSASDEVLVEIKFPNTWTPAAWRPFDRYIHDYIDTIVLEPRPEGIE